MYFCHIYLQLLPLIPPRPTPPPYNCNFLASFVCCYSITHWFWFVLSMYSWMWDLPMEHSWPNRSHILEEMDSPLSEVDSSSDRNRSSWVPSSTCWDVDCFSCPMSSWVKGSRHVQKTGFGYSLTSDSYTSFCTLFQDAPLSLGEGMPCISQEQLSTPQFDIWTSHEFLG